LRVKCIKSSWAKDKKSVTVRKGSFYHVVDIKKDQWVTQERTNVWYKLLETGSDMHVSTLFVEVKDEPTPTPVGVKRTKVQIDKNIMQLYLLYICILNISTNDKILV
jgi:hypothetical protein